MQTKAPERHAKLGAPADPACVHTRGNGAGERSRRRKNLASAALQRRTSGGMGYVHARERGRVTALCVLALATAAGLAPADVAAQDARSAGAQQGSVEPGTTAAEAHELDPARRSAGRKALEFFGGLVIGSGVFSGILIGGCTSSPSDECSDAGFAAATAVSALTAPAFFGLGIWLGGTTVGPDRSGATLGWDLLAPYIGALPGAAVISLAFAADDDSVAGGMIGAGGILAGIGIFAAGMYAHERQLRERHRLRVTPSVSVTHEGTPIVGLGSAF